GGQVGGERAGVGPVVRGAPEPAVDDHHQRRRRRSRRQAEIRDLVGVVTVAEGVVRRGRGTGEHRTMIDGHAPTLPVLRSWGGPRPAGRAPAARGHRHRGATASDRRRGGRPPRTAPRTSTASGSSRGSSAARTARAGGWGSNGAHQGGYRENVTEPNPQTRDQPARPSADQSGRKTVVVVGPDGRPVGTMPVPSASTPREQAEEER